MEKKVKLKRKLKIISIVLAILVLFLIYFLIKFLLSIKIQNIYVKTDGYLSDDYIIEKAGLSDYPSYFKSISMLIEDKLEDDIYIKKADVSKSFFGIVNIEVEENKLLIYKEVKELPYEVSTVGIVNYIPDTVYDKFYSKYLKLDDDIVNKISEIKYDPSEYDDSRFLLYMKDGNYVYLTITKFDNINYYNEIYPTLDGKKGILYLDSGNHFQEFN